MVVKIRISYEEAKAAVFYTLFRCRPCLKRTIQPCRSIGMLCISSAPGEGYFAGHDSLAFGAEEKGRSVTSPKSTLGRLRVLLA